MNLVSDKVTTRARIGALDAYMTANVLGADGFCCPSESACKRSALLRRDGTPRHDRTFTAGQLSHVGLHYDLTDSGRPWRILLIAMEVGRTEGSVTLEQRRLDQNNAIRVEFKTREQHMKGTTSALRVAFGRAPGRDREGELLQLANEPVPHHIMECYALANLRLCSANIAGTTTSAATPTMNKNCLRHLAATVQILEPTLCILQSVDIRGAIEPELSNIELIDARFPKLEYAEFAGVPTMIAAFPHPYQRGRNSHLNWGNSHSTPYLTEVVAPTITAARAFALD